MNLEEGASLFDTLPPEVIMQSAWNLNEENSFSMVRLFVDAHPKNPKNQSKEPLQ